MSFAAACPCGSGAAYVGCCGPLHDGLPAPTAEILMRSRYAAYVLGRTDYLLRTWHPRTRPDPLEAPSVSWLGLRVLSVQAGGPGDDTGTVEFEAHFTAPGTGDGTLHETSRFERRGGRWVYVDGDVS